MFGNDERWAAFVRQMRGDRRFIVGIGVESEFAELFVKGDSPTREQLSVMVKEMLGDDIEVEMPYAAGRTLRVRRKPFAHPPIKDI
jgi:hypothetical protein